MLPLATGLGVPAILWQSFERQRPNFETFVFSLADKYLLAATLRPKLLIYSPSIRSVVGELLREKAPSAGHEKLKGRTFQHRTAHSKTIQQIDSMVDKNKPIGDSFSTSLSTFAGDTEPGHHRVSCTPPVGSLCIEPTRFTRARHLSRSCARGSIAAGSRPSWSRSRLTTSNQRVRGAPRGHFQPKEPGSKSRIAREGWCGGRRSTCSAGKASLQ